MKYDFIVIGGGIVGAATAWQLIQTYPSRSTLLVEKESDFARHQTGRNSGVIHAGVYYAPGSLKAQFCKEGAAATIAFCREHNLPWQQCGKLLIATSALEIERMHALFKRCQQNEIAVELLTRTQLREREPNISGEGAIYVPATGMTDYAAICRKLLQLFVAAGGSVRASTEVKTIVEHANSISIITSRDEELRGDYLISCAGVMADRLARSQGLRADFRIVPFRGEYFRLRDNSALDNVPLDHAALNVSHHIYPIPDPTLPFLGIHLTRMIDGGITIGPNAVLAPGREAYTNARVNWGDMTDMAMFSGFWRLLPQYWQQGARELRNSLFIDAYLREAQKYCPHLTREDLLPHPSGIRAQAVDRTGKLVQDFLFVESTRSLHVCNAPSPAATSAIPIARHIVERISPRFSAV
ncbi:MAG: hydroxyglutarate oxidase [Verrucomicrobiaceae bacterium]|nr:hydroxyglutarate oxidase [Verrucomicrobiaceae bacterium]